MLGDICKVPGKQTARTALLDSFKTQEGARIVSNVELGASRREKPSCVRYLFCEYVFFICFVWQFSFLSCPSLCASPPTHHLADSCAQTNQRRKSTCRAFVRSARQLQSPADSELRVCANPVQMPRPTPLFHFHAHTPPPHSMLYTRLLSGTTRQNQYLDMLVLPNGFSLPSHTVFFFVCVKFEFDFYSGCFGCVQVPTVRDSGMSWIRFKHWQAIGAKTRPNLNFTGKAAAKLTLSSPTLTIAWFCHIRCLVESHCQGGSDFSLTDAELAKLTAGGDGSDEVTLANFLSTFEESSAAELTAAFTKADADANGKLTATELEQVSINTGECAGCPNNRCGRLCAYCAENFKDNSDGVCTGSSPYLPLSATYLSFFLFLFLSLSFSFFLSLSFSFFFSFSFSLFTLILSFSLSLSISLSLSLSLSLYLSISISLSLYLSISLLSYLFSYFSFFLAAFHTTYKNKMPSKQNAPAAVPRGRCFSHSALARSSSSCRFLSSSSSSQTACWPPISWTRGSSWQKQSFKRKRGRK